MVNDSNDKGHLVVKNYKHTIVVPRRETPASNWAREYLVPNIDDTSLFAFRKDLDPMVPRGSFDQIQIAILNALEASSLEVQEMTDLTEFNRGCVRFSENEIVSNVLSGSRDQQVCHISHSPCDRHPVPQINYPTNPVPKPMLEADCVVEFVIGEDGKPFDIEATCSNPAFVRSAERGIVNMQYATEDECGPCERRGERISYPIEYRLSD